MLLSDLELLRRLVAIDSTTGRSNLRIADSIAEYLHPHADSVEYIRSEEESKANLLIRFGPEGSEDRSGLILSGHMDAVAAEEEGWESDPLTLTDRGDRYMGRGSADMKGFLAIAMNAAAEARGLRAPLYLLFTFDEESGTRGAKHFVDRWDRSRPLPRSCVVGEPTSFRTVRAHKGHLKLLVTTSGRAAHSGYPHLGENAIEKAADALQGLIQLRRELEKERSPHADLFPDAPYVPLNIATVHGGAAVNVVPDHCEIEVGTRLLPGMSAEAMIERVRQAIGGAALELVNDSPPMLLPTDSEIYRAVAPLRVDGNRPESVSFASDAGWFQTLGVESVLFGPGAIEVAHRPNEYMPKEDFDRAPGIVRTLIRHFCGA